MECKINQTVQFCFDYKEGRMRKEVNEKAGSKQINFHSI